MKHKRFRIISIGILLIIGLVALGSWLIEGPLQRYMTVRINESLSGYELRLGNLDFHPIGGAIDFEDLKLIQLKHPTPPVATIRTITASVHWKALIFGRLVADFEIHQPDVTLDLAHIQSEARDSVPIEEKGWQETVRNMYPFEINRVTVRDGRLAYIGQGDIPPLVFDEVQFTAANIRNIQDSDTPYPSRVDLRGRLFESGQISFKGNANFLAASHPELAGRLEVGKLALERLSPALENSRLSIEGGRIETFRARLEYTASLNLLHINEARLQAVRCSYVHPGRDNALLSLLPTDAADTEAEKGPPLKWRIDNLVLTKGNIGFINRETVPPYRIFVSGSRVEIKDYSSGFENGPAVIRLKGAFMGSGNTAIYGTFRPENDGPDFDLRLAVEQTRIRDLNPLFKAYAGLDAADGRFSLFSEISVQEQRIDGYVKPLFHDMQFQSPSQDRNENLFQQIYEGIADVLTELLENETREDVATKTDL